MRSDPLMVLLAGPVVKCEMAMLELVVNVGCFPESAVARSPIPVNDMLFVALSVVAATEDTLKALLVVNVGCFAFNAVMTLVPETVSAPEIMAELHRTLPLTSTDGALTAQEKTALLLVMPRRSTLPESAKRSV